LTLFFNGKKLGNHQFTVVTHSLTPFHAILGMDWIKSNELELLTKGMRIQHHWVPYIRTTNERTKVSCVSTHKMEAPEREKDEEFYDNVGSITLVAVVDMEFGPMVTGTIPLKMSKIDNVSQDEMRKMVQKYKARDALLVESCEDSALVVGSTLLGKDLHKGRVENPELSARVGNPEKMR